LSFFFCRLQSCGVGSLFMMGGKLFGGCLRETDRPRTIANGQEGGRSIGSGFR
jgi:hypothetical protein